MLNSRTDAVTILKKIKELIINSKTGFLVQEIANKLNLDRKTVIKYADALVDLGVIDVIKTNSGKRIYIPEFIVTEKDLEKVMKKHPDWSDKKLEDVFEYLLKEYTKNVRRDKIV